MKRVSLLLLVALVVISCKKTKHEPEGPTDVRIYNNTDQLFENVVVKTSDDETLTNIEYNFGSISSGAYSDYHRFDIAYPKADITLTIGGIEFKTPDQDYTYMQYMGQMKMTYKIYIKNQSLRQLDTNVVPEGDLDDL